MNITMNIFSVTFLSSYYECC